MNHYYTVYSVAIRNTPRTEYTGCDVGELLYMDYQEMLTRYLLRHRDMAAASERELFEKVLTVWKHYKVLMKWNMRAFAYLSRYYIVNNFKPSLEQVAVSIFLEQFFRMHSASVNSVTLDLLDRDRAGECTNKELIKRAIELFTVMKVDDTHFAYKDSFLRDYIAKTEKYCKRVLEEWCGSLSARELTDKIIQSLDEERERCSYFSAEDARQIMACVESVFVGSPSTTRKILDEEGGFRTMLEREETEWLTKCFNLFSTRDTSLKKLADIFAALIVKQGEILSDAYKNEETYVDVVAYVQSMMKLQETFPRVAKLCFNMDFVMSKALREGLEGAYNTSVEVKCKGEESMQVKFCLWLASYADLVLQARVPNPDEELERITVTLSYITERDLFLNSLREKMAGRVLLPVRELNENMERAFIQRIRQRYGPASTSYLEGMLHDILISNDFL
ncbi:cullin 1 [Angomonas deanei]|nr:cullin 1 [Angomonas deanei]|eukprot:EPY37966.1 cullin 1 [Angomonas deanei]